MIVMFREEDNERLHGSPGDYAWGPSGLDNIISQLLTQFGDNGPPPAEQDKIDSLPTVSVDAENAGMMNICLIIMCMYRNLFRY